MAAVVSLIGITAMFGPHELFSQTPAPTAPVTSITLGAGYDSNWLPIINQLLTDDQAAKSTIAGMQTDIAALKTAVQALTPAPGSPATNPPPPCVTPNTMVNGVCTPPPTPTPTPTSGNPILNAAGTAVIDFNVKAVAAVDQTPCQGAGAGTVPAGSTGSIVAGPKSFTVSGVSTVCVNVAWPSAAAQNGWTPVSALAGQ
jgi:hypothetical protein